MILKSIKVFIMRYSLVILILVLVFGACKDDDNVSFGVSLTKDNLRFKPVPGGAVMYYSLPVSDNVFGLQIRYKDARGSEVVKRSSYIGDSLIIDGFNKAETNVPASVSLVDRNNNESEVINVSFDTEESSTYSFFDNVKVGPYWGGFQVVYGGVSQSSGMVHVMYLGTNPLTHKEDTVLLKSYPITASGDTLNFVLQQDWDKTTVILRTEDYRGYRVRQEIWEDVKIYSTEKLALTEDNFINKQDCSVENEKEKIGAKYLFDGDMKGEQRLLSGKIPELYSFLGGPQIQNECMIFDLGNVEVPAAVRIYGALKSLEWPLYSIQYTSSVYEIFRGIYDDKLPCAVTLYGSNDKDSDNWVRLGSFKQESEALPQDRWSERCNNGTENFFGYTTEKELKAALPACAEILLPCHEEMSGFRYIKLVVDELFKYVYFAGATPMVTVINTQDYVAIQELEIYVKKD